MIKLTFPLKNKKYYILDIDKSANKIIIDDNENISIIPEEIYNMINLQMRALVLSVLIVLK